MKKDFLTDEQVEAEISRLNGSEYVSLARKEQRIKYRRRQYMYTLLHLEKRGKQLAEQGITSENIEKELFDEEWEA